MFTKRGVSPLIATVLLIAFAVSLGAVLINLGVNLFGNPCKDVVVEVVIVEDRVRMCHIKSTQMLSITVANQGENKVDGFKLSIVGNVAFNEDIPEVLEPLDKKILQYPVPELDTVDVVTIVPYIEKSGKVKYCSDAERTYIDIRSC